MIKKICICLTILGLALFLGNCPDIIDYTVTTESRTFVIDVENTAFNAADTANAWERGLGLTSLSLTVYIRDAAGVEIPVTRAITAGDLVPAYSCTRFSLAISGTLLRVEAAGQTAAGTAYTAAIDDKAEADAFAGWTVFANCLKVRLGFALDHADPAGNALFYRVAPLGGGCAHLRYDAGVQAAGAGFTDRAAGLTANQIAFELDLQEDPTGLTYDVYTAVIDENIAALYDENTNLGAYYTDYPWSGLWTFGEITATGKNVAGSVYTLTRATTTSCTILDPLGDGFEAYLIDLSASPVPALNDKFILIAVVLQYGGLSVPAKVLCVDIK